MPIYLHVRSASFRFSPANYLQVRFRALTASRAVITRNLSIRSDRSTTDRYPVGVHRDVDQEATEMDAVASASATVSCRLFIAPTLPIR